jgi:hypothetical protein
VDVLRLEVIEKENAALKEELGRLKRDAALRYDAEALARRSPY